MLEIGRWLSGPREMVKLLRLCVDYGEDKVLKAIASLKSPELSVDQIGAFVTQVNTPEKMPVEIDIPVPNEQGGCGMSGTHEINSVKESIKLYAKATQNTCICRL